MAPLPRSKRRRRSWRWWSPFSVVEATWFAQGDCILCFLQKTKKLEWRPEDTQNICRPPSAVHPLGMTVMRFVQYLNNEGQLCFLSVQLFSRPRSTAVGRMIPRRIPQCTCNTENSFHTAESESERIDFPKSTRMMICASICLGACASPSSQRVGAQHWVDGVGGIGGRPNGGPMAANLSTISPNWGIHCVSNWRGSTVNYCYCPSLVPSHQRRRSSPLGQIVERRKWNRFGAQLEKDMANKWRLTPKPIWPN